MTTPLSALLAGVVDYAGLFPPAGLGMEETTRNYDRYRRGPRSWMLGELVIPLGRWGEFLTAAAPLLSEGDPWPLSILVPPIASGSDLDALAPADVGAAGTAVEALELKVGSEAEAAVLPALFDRLAGLFPGAEIHVEAVGGIAVDRLLGRVAELRARTGRGAGKIRTGGVTREAWVDAGRVAEFILHCRSLGVPWKATAGLHHPLPAVRPLTYEPDAPSGPMHGFLNVLVASAVALAEPDSTVVDLTGILSSTHRPELRESAIGWPEGRADVEAIRTARRDGCLSFGSCSFEDPVHDLEDLGFDLTPEHEGNG